MLVCLATSLFGVSFVLQKAWIPRTGEVLPMPGWANKIFAYFSTLKTDSANLVAGLSVGYDQGLSKTFGENMKVVGLTHLTAVSGANCAIVIGLAWVLLRKIPIAKSLKTVLTITVLVFYVELVGWQASVLRAAFMMSIVFLTLELGKKVWITAVLAIASLLLLVVDPTLVFNWGFWLSVLATFGLVTLTPAVNLRLQKYLPKPVAILVAATSAAQLWCLPLLVSLQGGLTTYSVLSNLLVEPMVAPITVLGLLAALLSLFSVPLASYLVALANVPASYVVFVANALASNPLPIIPIPVGFWGVISISSITVSIALFLLGKSNIIIKVISTVLSVFLIFNWVAVGGKSLVWPMANWSILNCDVGQGDALILRSNNEIALIDVGKDPKLIVSCLNNAHVSTINLLVLTHFDMDHVGAVADAIRGRRVDQALISGFPDERPEAKFIKGLLNSKVGAVQIAKEGQSGKLGDLDWSIISALDSTGASANESSIGMDFEANDYRVITLADLNEVAQCKVAPRMAVELKLTIVKVSHHGSADQCPELYQAIQPDLALISVGKNNGYGHPTNSCLQMLNRLKVKILRTDQNGAIAVSAEKSGIQFSVAGPR